MTLWVIRHSNHELKMHEAVVFDMDGLMIDSQPYWQTAQLEILPQLGVPTTRQDTIDTTGMRIDRIVQMCYAQSPWNGVSCEEVCNRILKRVTELVQQHRPTMPGLNHTIEVCRQQRLKLALASSSPMGLIDATIEALRLDGVFAAKSSRRRPCLLLVAGLRGTGKFTLAHAVAEQADFQVSRSDVVRKEFTGVAIERRSPSTFGKGIYTAE